METLFRINKNFWAKEIHRGGPGPVHETGGHAQEGWARPHTRGQGVVPLVLILSPVFFIFSKKCLRGFSGHSENFCFLHIKQHHGSSAENIISPG